MPFEYDFQNTIIEAGSDDVSIQTLINSIRYAEATISGIVYPHIANATGKQTLADLGGGEKVEVGITCDLQNGWQLHFLPGNYTVTIEGGNLVGGLGGDPVSYSAGVQTLIIQSAAATLVTAAGGSGLSQSEHDQLFALPSDTETAGAVWNEQLGGYTTSGSAGNTLLNASQNTALLQVDIQDALGLSGENTEWTGIAHDANFNLISAVISQYTDDTLIVLRKRWQLTATYDVNSQLTSYQLKEY